MLIGPMMLGPGELRELREGMEPVTDPWRD